MPAIFILILILSVSVRVAGEQSLIAFANQNDKTDYSVFNKFNIKTSLYDAEVLEKNQAKLIENLKTAQVLEINKKGRKIWAQLLKNEKLKNAVKQFLANGGTIFCNYNTSKNGNAFLEPLEIPILGPIDENTKNFANGVAAEKSSDFNNIDTPFRGHCGWKKYSKNFIPVIVMEDDPQAAMLLVQQNVLGKGRIIYSNLIDFLLWQKKKEKVRRKKNIELLIKLMFSEKAEPQK